MENHFPFHDINPIENMIINIKNEGQKEIWNYIETEKNPLERCEKRKLYWRALNIMLKEGEK